MLDKLVDEPKLYTSNIKYEGKGRVDITAKTGDKSFAPPWDLVWGYKDGNLSEAEYVDFYVRILENRYKEHKDNWGDLLKSEQTVLCCYCSSETFCHRQVLAEYLSIKYGVEYVGEMVGDYIIW